MLRFTWLGGVSAAVFTTIVGCAPASLDADAPGTAARATLSATLVVSLDQTSINEGQGDVMHATQVCADAPTDVTATVDWADPDDLTPTAATITPTIALGGACLGDGFIVCDPAAERLGAGGNDDGVCDPGETCMVCDFAKPAGYADNLPADASRTVTVTFQQGAASSVSQGVPLTVHNVAPSIIGTASSGQLAEGVTRTYSSTVNDPGLRADEIESVDYAFTSGGALAPDGDIRHDTGLLLAEQIHCDCASNVCSEEPADLPIPGLVSAHCQIPGAANTDDDVLASLLDDDGNPLNFSVTITDHDGATATDASLNANVVNVPPQNVRIPLLSVSSGTPTVVDEGSLVNLSLTFTEQGSDDLDIAYDVDTLAANAANFSPADITGTAAITKASYPDFDPAGDTTPVLNNGFIDTPGTTQFIDDSAGIRALKTRFDNPTGTTPLDLKVAVRVNDDDLGTNTQNHFVHVVDVNPGCGLTVSTPGPINEGDIVTYTAVATSGAQDPVFDPVNATGFRWSLDTDDITGSPGDGLGFTVVSGCVGTADAAPAASDATATATCVIQYLDADVSRVHGMIATCGDEDSTSNSPERDVAVNNVKPVIDATTTITAGPQNETTLAAADNVTVTASFTDPAGALDGSYTTTVVWGDGTADSTASTAAPGTSIVLGHHYHDNSSCDGGTNGALTNTCSVTVTTCEADTSLCSAPFPLSIVIANVPPTPSVDSSPTLNQLLVEGVPVSLDGSFDDPAADLDEQYAIDWSWNDFGTTRHSTPSPADFVDRATGPDVSGGLLFTQVPAGTTNAVPVTLVVTDNDLGSGSVSRNVSVRDDVPVVSIDSLDFANVRAGVTNRNGIIIADDDELATPTIQVTVSPETLDDLLTRLVIDWGDGTQSTLNAVASGDIPAPDEFNEEGDVITIEKPAPYPDSSEGQPSGHFVITATIIDEEGVVNAAIPGRNPVATQNAVVNNLDPEIVSINNIDVDNVTPVPTPVIVSEGQAAVFVVASTDEAPPDRQPPGFLTHFDWGDGTSEDQGGAIAGANAVSRAAHIFPNVGTFDVTITQHDKDGGASFPQHVQVEVVNVAPEITDVFTTLPVAEGATINGVALVDNRGADPLHFSFNFDCANATPTDADFPTDPRPVDGNGDGVADGFVPNSAVLTHVYPDGPLDTLMCVRVCDDDVAPNSCDFGSVAVHVDNVAPTISLAAVPANATIAESGTVAITATVADAAGAADPLSVRFDCNDDGVIDTGVGDVAADTSSPFSTTCAYADSGTFTVRATVSDGDGGSAERTLTVHVNNAPPAALSLSASTVSEGQPTVFSATASDPGDDALTLQIDTNGDGTFELQSAFAAGTGSRAASASFAFGTSGDRTVNGRVCDNEGACTAYAPLAVTVNNAAPTLVTAAAAAVSEGTPTVFTANGTDPGNDPLEFEFDLDNNSTSAGAFTADLSSTSGTASATLAEGAHPVAVRVCDLDPVTPLCSAITVITATVNNTAPVIQSVNVPATSPEGASVTAAVSATDAGNDALNYVFTFSSGATNIRVPASGNQASPLASAVLPFDGAWNVSVDVNDGAATVTSPVNPITVTNVAPVVSSLTAPAAVGEGTATVNVSATVSDAGAGDNLTVTFDCADDGTADFTDGPDTGAGLGTLTHNCAASFGQSGVFVVRVSVTDDGGASSDRTAVVRVNNVAPAALTFASSTVAEGQPTVFTATASDAGNDEMTLQIDANGDGTFELSSAFAGGTGTRTATASFPFAQSGTHNVNARVCDAEGACAAYVAGGGVDLSVTVNNAAPTLTAAAAADVNEGSPTVFTANGTDPGNDALRFEFDIDNNSTNAASFTADLTSASGTAQANLAEGAHSVAARVCDLDTAPLCSAIQVFTTTVNNVAPVVQAVNLPASVVEGSSVTVSVTATDAGNDTLRYAFTFSDGTTTIRVPDTGDQTPPVASATIPSNGNWNLAIEISDGTTTITSPINPFFVTNAAPLVTTLTAPSSIDEGSATANVSARVSDPGVNDQLTVVFDCNDDGAPDFTDGPATAATLGLLTHNCAAAFAQSGVFVTRVTVTDDDAPVPASSDRTAVIRVNNVAPTLDSFTATTVDQGQPTVFTATASDAGGDALTVQFDFQVDGVFDATAAVTGGTATTSFVLPRGSRDVAARACDAEGACSATQQTGVTVNNVAPTVTKVTAPTTAVAGSPVTVAVTATDPGNDALTFTYVFSLGGVVKATVANTGPVATATFSDAGNYTVAVTANDGQADSVPSASSSASFVVTDISVTAVAFADPNPVNEGSPTAITVNIPSGTGPFVVSYDINGDGDFDDAVDQKDVDCADDPCTVNATYPNNNPGNAPFRVLAQVTDTGNGGAVSTAITSVEVDNVAPTLDAITDQTVEEQSALTVTATATDPGTEDVLAFSLVTSPDGMTIDSASGQIDWTPDFNQAGDNPVTVRVTDSDGAANDTSFTVTVTIIDTNANGVSDTQERLVNGGELLCTDTASCDALATTDTDGDGVNDLAELVAGTDPNTSDAPQAPTIISPDNGVNVGTSRPTLTVANAVSPRGLALTYTFCIVDTRVGGDPTCTDPRIAEGPSTTAFTVDTDLAEGGPYEWFATANDGIADGAESAHATFNVNAINEAPPASENLSPADASHFLQGVPPTLEGRAVVDPDGDAVSYTFEVATDDAFTNIVSTSAARSVPFFTVPDALDPGTYHWHVTTSDGVLSGAASTATTFVIDEFVVNTAPGEPGIDSPNNTVVASTSATLTITAATDPEGDAVQYELEAADNPAFANPQASGPQDGLTFDVSNLKEDSTVFWRARAFDGELFSDWVNAVFVVNAENGAPAGLALLSPTDGALLDTAPTAFVVQNAIDPEGDPLTYTFTIANDKELADVVLTQDVAEGKGTTSFEPGAEALKLTAGSTYFWKVSASDGTNSVEATGSFKLFKDSAAVAPTGGCGCDMNGNSGATPLLALFGLVALGGLRRRRRRRD